MQSLLKNNSVNENVDDSSTHTCIQDFESIVDTCQSLESATNHFGCDQMRDTIFTIRKMSIKAQKATSSSIAHYQQKVANEFTALSLNIDDLKNATSRFLSDNDSLKSS